ncbi:LppU/SCO3897 family protein [Streptomyces vinaceus]|uniref:LppU/SCO3897 family protein n=1 Tax=Streptomyces vinaceus TaxID=1960 RepID=UPI0036C1807A
MSSQEIQLTITPEQAAHGVILPVSLPGGTTRLRIPSGCRDGQLVSVRAGGAEVAVRLRIAPAAGTPAPPPTVATPTPTPAPPPTVATPAVPGQRPSRSGGTAGCLAVLAAIATVIIAAVALNSGDDGKGTAASSSPTPTYSSWSPTPLPTGTSYTSGTSTGTGSSSGSGSVPYPSTAPTAAAPAPSPFDAGTCLNGQLPDSTTAQRVEDVNEVSCSASDAHYKVIQRFGFTSDLHSCDANPRTEYAFSYRYTLNGTPINQYVYCLVGLGSYARS